ncbi:MAG: glycosyltransferase family 39 protein, partial [Actinomycetota bacterium]|nr:glycosyltransferase family 39 protein [Actinomycetota bacterium]
PGRSGAHAATASPAISPHPDVAVEAPASDERVSAPRGRPPAGWRSPVVVGAGLLGLTVVSLSLSLRGMGVSLWLDEGLSVGIASHRWADIPGLLAQDGSPPLYYLVLHAWMEAFGRSEEAVRALSLLFGLVTVPVAFWLTGTLFDRRSAWVAAVLAATSGYLTYYGREARMYTLLVLLALVAVVAFVHVVVLGRRRWIPLLVAGLALALYTHNWALYLVVGLGMTTVWILVKTADRRRTLVDALVAFGGVAVLYAPWVPTLVFQAAHTSAPWSQRPDPAYLLGALGSVLSDQRVVVALVLVALPALVEVVRRGGDRATGSVVTALAVVLVATLLAAWTSSQLRPAWASRYFGLFLPPLLLLAAVGLARAGRRGLLALALVVGFWAQPVVVSFAPERQVPQKSNVRRATSVVAPVLEAGDLVVSVHMEHVPLLRYYLGPHLRYADPSGLVVDPAIADWRDAVDRMGAADPRTGLLPLVDQVRPGGHVALVCPRYDVDPDDLLWFRLMDRNCAAWRAALDGEPGLQPLLGPVAPPPLRSPGSSIAVRVYERT